MPPNRFESEVESFLEGSHGDRTHIKRADHHTVTPLCGTLLITLAPPAQRRLADTQHAAGLGRTHALTSQRLGFLQLYDNLLRRVLRELPHGHPFCPATSSRDYSEQPSQNKRSEKPGPLQSAHHQGPRPLPATPNQHPLTHTQLGRAGYRHSMQKPQVLQRLRKLRRELL